MITRAIILFLFIFSVESSELKKAEKFSCPSQLTDLAIFKLLMETEFAGVQYEGAKKECLDQSNFPYLSVSPDFAQDVREQKLLLVDPKSLTNIELKRVDEFQKIYKVNFTVKARSNLNEELKEHKDTATILIHQSMRVHARNGCAAFLQRPDAILIRAECLPIKEGK
jgi:hypothetical protein